MIIFLVKIVLAFDHLSINNKFNGDLNDLMVLWLDLCFLIKSEKLSFFVSFRALP